MTGFVSSDPLDNLTNPYQRPPCIAANRLPTTNDQQPPMTLWQNGPGGLIYLSKGAGIWNQVGSSASDVNTLTGDDSVAVSPSSNNIDLNGTTNQITTTSGVNSIIWSIPSTFVAPGSIEATTTLAAGTELSVTGNATIGGTLGVTGTATFGTIDLTTLVLSGDLSVGGSSTFAATAITGTTTINTSGAAVTTIGTGGTGALNLGNATGNTAVTGSLTASAGLVATTGGVTATAGGLTVTAGGAGITGTTNINTTGASVTSINTGGTGALHLGNATGNTAVTGSLTTTTTLTATSGAITATNGNLVLGTAGNKQIYSSVATTTAGGANSAGSVALVGGTATVATTAVTANSLIRLTCQALGTVIVPSALCVSALTASTNFTILASDATDTSTIFWEIVN